MMVWDVFLSGVMHPKYWKVFRGMRGIFEIEANEIRLCIPI